MGQITFCEAQYQAKRRKTCREILLRRWTRRSLEAVITTLKFRHFLERHGLGKVLFKEVNKRPEKDGLMLREGCIVDAPTISAFNSTKSESGQRDRIVGRPEMHIGVDDAIGVPQNIFRIFSNL